MLMQNDFLSLFMKFVAKSHVGFCCVYDNIFEGKSVKRAYEQRR